jgi:hypothetical protein
MLLHNVLQGTLTRNFSSGTSVTWKNGEGHIYWAGDPPTPGPAPTPPPPPPAPTPAIQPSASCPVIYQGCGWEHGDLKTVRSVAHWADCCSACHAYSDCTKWVFEPDVRAANNGTVCKLHSASATHNSNPKDGKICGTTSNATTTTPTTGGGGGGGGGDGSYV